MPHGKPTRIKTFLRLAFSSYSIYVLSLILCFIIFKTRYNCIYAANIKTFSILPITPPHFSISLTIFLYKRQCDRDDLETGNGQTSRGNAHSPIRIFLPEKPFNPAPIRITICNHTGCECMVCISNPSLMKGLSCPEIG